MIIKAAQINIFTWPVGQITTFIVKGVPQNRESIDNYHLNLMFLSALWGILASFSLLFWFLVDSHLSEQPKKKVKKEKLW